MAGSEDSAVKEEWRTRFWDGLKCEGRRRGRSGSITEVD